MPSLNEHARAEQAWQRPVRVCLLRCVALLRGVRGSEHLSLAGLESYPLYSKNDEKERTKFQRTPFVLLLRNLEITKKTVPKPK